jgi:hypothetical protein
LHIDGVGVTQSDDLDGAEVMVRDLIRLRVGVPADSFDVEITPELGGERLGAQAARRLADIEHRSIRRRGRWLDTLRAVRSHSRAGR